MKINKPQNKIIFVIITVLLFIGIYLLIAWVNHLPPFHGPDTSIKPGDHTVNMERSESEKKATETLKNNPETKLDNTQRDIPVPPSKNSSTGKQQAAVLLTNTGIFNGTVSASGMVTNVVEENGRCTFTFSNGGEVINKVSQTMTNPTSTSCQTVSFPVAELSNNGVWKVQIQYDSNTSSGISNTKEFTR